MKKYTLISFFGFVGVFMFTFWFLPSLFFQQDEWHHLGREYVWHEKGFYNFFINDALSPFGLRFLPLAYLANFFQFSLFKANPAGYALVSIFIHFINSMLVFWLARKLTGKNSIATITTFVFATSIAHIQATTWLIQHTTTLPALSFSILAIIKYIDYVKDKNYKHLATSFLFFIAAIFFKETAFFVAIFIPILALLLSDKNKKAGNFKKSLLYIATLIIYFVILFTISKIAVGTAETQSISHSGTNIGTIARRLVSIPLRVFLQSFFGEQFLNLNKIKQMLPDVFDGIFPEFRTFEYDFIFENHIAKNILYALSVLLIFALAVWYRKNLLEKDLNTMFLIAIAFIFSSTFPLIFISQGDFLYLSSRYLYIPVVGTSLAISIFISSIYKRNRLLGASVLLIYLVTNIYFVKTFIRAQINQGKMRKGILTQIANEYPNLPDKVVFYIESDTAYYGLPHEDTTLPFQSGFGQTLLVWYQASERFPVQFFEDDYLWEIKSQGYKEIDGRGFGYFRDEEKLKETIKVYNLESENIVAFEWQEEVFSLKNTTEEIRNEVVK